MKLRSQRTITPQTGSVLIVALMLLLLLTILGINSMSMLTMQERIAANYQKMDYAFQGAQNAVNIALKNAKANGGAGTLDVAVATPYTDTAPLNQNLDPKSTVKGISSSASTTARCLGASNNIHDIAGWDDSYEAIFYLLKTQSTVTVAGTRVAGDEQEQTVKFVHRGDLHSNGLPYEDPNATEPSS